MYYGESASMLDEKGRITVPARMRQTMEVLKHSDWYMTRGYDHCLFLFPHPFWEQILEQLGQFSPMDPRALDFRRLLYGSVAEVSPDRQGRIPVPAHLREHAFLELKQEAIVLGVGGHIEIWNAGAWRAFRDGSYADFKVMGERMWSGAPGAGVRPVHEEERVRS